MLAALLSAALLHASPAPAELVRGGGSLRSDCLAVLDVPGANRPPAPRAPRHMDCTDGDPTCDADGMRNGICVFDLRVCANSTALPGKCSSEGTEEILIDHAVDNGDPRFDPEFQALQARVDVLGLPDDFPDLCTLQSALSVPLRGPNARDRMRPSKKKLVLSAFGTAGGRAFVDRDRMRFRCRPEGDRVYLPRDLYTGTFDRIQQQVFSQSCALSGCHDSESNAGGMRLEVGVAWSQLVTVAAQNPVAAQQGLLRVEPGDAAQSFLVRKLRGDLESGMGSSMPLLGNPLPEDLLTLIELWIAGDGSTGPAPETGWVTGTD